MNAAATQFGLRASVAAIVGVAVSGCDGVQSALSFDGSDAARITVLTIVMVVAATAIFLLVMTVLAFALWGSASARKRLASPSVVFAGGVVFPCVVLSALLGYGFAVMRTSTHGEPGALELSVVGEQWWWRVQYPDGRGGTFETANELVVPVGRPVRIALTTADVLHSFWVPAYAGKLDMVPGRTNYLTLTASSPGLVRGQCAEYCGGAHALMSLFVRALPPAEFATWREREAADAERAETGRQRRGATLFAGAGCGGCHTIRGTAANGLIGPDLTHLGSRHSLAAATLPNNAAAIARWIAHNETIKPGNLMPEYRVFSDADLHALADYLFALK